MIEELLQYYPKPEPLTLEQIYNKYGDRLSEEEKEKLKNLL